MRKRNPWVSISDLLSSVVLILLLMFVMASIIPKYTQEAQRHQMMERIKTALHEYEESEQIAINSDTGLIEFKDATFAQGDSRPKDVTVNIIRQLAETLKAYMVENEMMEIMFEGHTDAAPIKAGVINLGGYYTNNVELSMLRAEHVRDVFVQSIGAEYSKRVGAAGYGETRLKDAASPLSPENRRIEMRILWNGQAND